MGYQFIHVESYARKAGKDKSGGNSISTIAGEADRLSDSISHIEKPKPPIILYGVSATKVAEMAEKWADESIDARGHKLRKDGLCLLAGVISCPDDLDDWTGFKKSSYSWLKEKYGDRLKSIIEHTDESHRHMHFYVIPRPGEKFDSIHQGKKAASEVKESIPDEKNPAPRQNFKGAQNKAYKKAMEEYQDEFSKGVAMQFGLTKLGPGRRRLTRDEWNQEQKKAAFFASAKAQYKSARKKGYKDGQAEAKEELSALGKRAGTALAAVGAAVLSKWHQPTQEAILQREKDQKKLDEEVERRRVMQLEYEAKLDRQLKLHQAEVSRLQRIAQNAETEANSLEKKLQDLSALNPPKPKPKTKGLDI